MDKTLKIGLIFIICLTGLGAFILLGYLLVGTLQVSKIKASTAAAEAEANKKGTDILGNIVDVGLMAFF